MNFVSTPKLKLYYFRQFQAGDDSFTNPYLLVKCSSLIHHQI